MTPTSEDIWAPRLHLSPPRPKTPMRKDHARQQIVRYVMASKRGPALNGTSRLLLPTGPRNAPGGPQDASEGPLRQPKAPARQPKRRPRCVPSAQDAPETPPGQFRRPPRSSQDGPRCLRHISNKSLSASQSENADVQKTLLNNSVCVSLLASKGSQMTKAFRHRPPFVRHKASATSGCETSGSATPPGSPSP